jgi:C-terminal processing protease CtpA/Prc
MKEKPATKIVDNWWEADPYAVGGGLGIVLHQKSRNRWLVAEVLCGSPAEKAGVLRGDYLLQVDDYPLATPDNESLSSWDS